MSITHVILDMAATLSQDAEVLMEDIQILLDQDGFLVKKDHMICLIIGIGALHAGGHHIVSIAPRIQFLAQGHISVVSLKTVC